MGKIKNGDMFITNEGGTVKVLNYINAKEVVIQHQDEHGHIQTKHSSGLRRGSVKNPYRKSVHGVGYLGVGEHRAYFQGKQTTAYNIWVDMLRRCYSEVSLIKLPTYKGCSVVEEWHNFQNFADWYYQQPNARKKGFDLDKDLTVSGNKRYGSDTCSLVPQQINSVLLNSKASRGNLPQGVTLHNKKYRARLYIEGEYVAVGLCDSPEEAFLVYKKEKENEVKRVTNKYKDFISDKIYHNLMEWEVTEYD